MRTHLTACVVLPIVAQLMVSASIFAQPWTPTSAPTRSWTGVAASADGTKLVAVATTDFTTGILGSIYTSADSGATWISTSAPPTNWWCVASSADGTILAAGVGGSPGGGSPVQTSKDSGTTWTENDVLWFHWASVTISADGTKLAAVAEPIYTLDTLANPGLTWVETSASYLRWSSIASSADGSRLIAAADIIYVGDGTTGVFNPVGGSVWTSADYGVTWQFCNLPLFVWHGVASSADGSRLVAVGAPPKSGGGSIFTSTDGGLAWTKTRAPNKTWFAVASSSDGVQLAAIAGAARQIYLSTDGGVTWTDSGAPRVAWTSIASSADGDKLVAVAGGLLSTGQIFTWQRPAPTLSITLSGSLAAIKWPLSSRTYRLQKTARLDLPNWSDLAAATIQNQENFITVPVVGDARFYRLVSP